MHLLKKLFRNMTDLINQSIRKKNEKGGVIDCISFWFTIVVGYLFSKERVHLFSEKLMIHRKCETFTPPLFIDYSQFQGKSIIIGLPTNRYSFGIDYKSIFKKGPHKDEGSFFLL